MKKRATYIIGSLIFIFLVLKAWDDIKKDTLQDLWIKQHCREIDRQYYDGGNHISKKQCDNGEIKWVN